MHVMSILTERRGQDIQSQDFELKRDIVHCVDQVLAQQIQSFLQAVQVLKREQGNGGQEYFCAATAHYFRRTTLDKGRLASDRTASF